MTKTDYHKIGQRNLHHITMAIQVATLEATSERGEIEVVRRQMFEDVAVYGQQIVEQNEFDRIVYHALPWWRRLVTAKPKRIVV